MTDVQETSQAPENTSSGTQQEGQIEGGRDFEKEARDMGWVPQEDFHDAPEKWVDAQSFVERGEHILPILRANNKKFRKDLEARDRQLAEVNETLANQKKVIKTLQKHYGETIKTQLAAMRKELVSQLKEAKQVGDVDEELRLSDEISTLKETEKKQAAELVPFSESEKPTAEAAEQKLSPEFVEWGKKYPWYGDMNNRENRRKTEDFIRVAEDLREDGDVSTGTTFLAKAMEEYEKRFPEKPHTGKVEGASRGVRAASGGRLYDQLPKEAKDACMEDASMFVGPGKMFKELKDWQNHYANIYNED